MTAYADGVSRLPDACLRSQVLRLLDGYTFKPIAFLDHDSMQTLRDTEYCAMAKVTGTRTLAIMVVHATTGEPCTVLYDRTATMYRISQMYTSFAPDTILDGVVTRTVDDDWVYLFFDVPMYRGIAMNYVLRQCAGVKFVRSCISTSESDCFEWQWQHYYPLDKLCEVFEEKTYHVEGVVFKSSQRVLKWNFLPKRRGLVRVRARRANNGKIELDLLAEDNTEVGKCVMALEGCVQLLQSQPLPRVECVWRQDRWQIAKPCTDHETANSRTELEAVRHATVHDITIDDIIACTK